MAKAKKPTKKVDKKKAPSKAKAAAKKVVAKAKKPAAKTTAKAAASKAKPAAKAAAKPAAGKVKAPAAAKGKVAAKAAPVEKTKPAAKEPKVVVEPVLEVTEVEVIEAPEDVVLTDAEGRRYCRVKDCDQLATVDTYCRYHYLLYWKKIQIRKKILTEGKLERYIEELTARYPDKFLDMLRKDLRSEKEFLTAIQELEIDESQNDSDFEDENENFIDEVRGMSEPAARADDDEF